MEQLRERGVLVSYSDPHVPRFPSMRMHSFELDSEQLSVEVVRSYDAVVLATDHDSFDYEMILEASQLIIDSRGRYRGENSKVVNA